MDAAEMYQKVKDGDDSASTVALKMAATELLLQLNTLLAEAIPLALAAIRDREPRR